MKAKASIPRVLVPIFLAVSGIVMAQESNHNRSLLINGHSSQVPVIQVDGRRYVDLEALAGALNGTLSFSGSEVAFSLPSSPAPAGSSTGIAESTASPAQTANNTELSKGFLSAGIEAAATLREWHAALASSIQNGYPVTVAALAPYRGEATTNLRLASVAISTDSDRRAFHLLSNIFQNMGELTDKYVTARSKLTFISPDALQNDRLNQRLVICAHSLSSMAASGQFVDDGSCN